VRLGTGASRFLTGLVTCFTTHGGIPAIARSMRGFDTVFIALRAALSDWFGAPGDAS